MLGRLEMNVDTCIDAFIKLSEGVFTPKRHRANLTGRLADAFFFQGVYDVEVLISVVREFVQQSEGDEEAPMLSHRTVIFDELRC